MKIIGVEVTRIAKKVAPIEQWKILKTTIPGLIVNRAGEPFEIMRTERNGPVSKKITVSTVLTGF